MEEASDSQRLSGDASLQAGRAAEEEEEGDRRKCLKMSVALV